MRRRKRARRTDPDLVRDLGREFERLSVAKDHHRRGRDFEDLLMALLERLGFQPFQNARVAAPRQTDICFRWRDRDMLVEAKWQRKTIDVSDIGSLRDRLAHAAPGMVGCLITMADLSPAAIERMEDERDEGEILVINRQEIELLFGGCCSLDELLGEKTHGLRMHGRVWLYDPGTSTPDSDGLVDLPRRESRFLSRVAVVTSMKQTGRGGSQVFALDIPETGWGHSGDYGARISLFLQTGNLKNLANLFHILNTQLQLTCSGTFAIHQDGASWYGMGVRNFLDQLKDPLRRYRRARLPKHHHSEQAIYFDSCQGGWLQLSIQRASEFDSFDHGQLEIRLRGFPLQNGRLLKVCQAAGYSDPVMNHVSVREHHFHSFKRPEKVQIDVLDFIIQSDGHRRIVTGLVARNPFANPSVPLPLLGDRPWEAQDLRKPGVVLCDLLHHHEVGTEVDYYELVTAEAVWLAPRPVLRLACTWNRLLRPAKPKPRQSPESLADVVNKVARSLAAEKTAKRPARWYSPRRGLES